MEKTKNMLQYSSHIRDSVLTDLQYMYIGYIHYTIELVSGAALYI